MGRYKIPLDAYDMKPEGMIAYLRYNGWHFNKKMCDWAQFIKDMVDDPDQADGFISIDFMPIATIMVSAFHGMMYYD